MLVLTPLDWVPRYTLFLLVLGGCAVSVVYRLLGPWARRWICTMTVVLALFAILNSVDHHYFSVQRIRTFVALPDTQRTTTRFDPGTFGPTYQWVERFIPPGSVIAYSNNVSRPFPLWGVAFKHHVIAVTTADPTRYIDDLQAAGVQFIFIGSQGKQVAALVADQRVRLVFDGGDGWKVFELQ
jgi:hypothetical protein